MVCKLLHSAVFLCFVFCCTTAEVAKVVTKVGEIVGTNVMLNLDGVPYEVNQFLGIHYAKPPVGDLRFRKSEPYGELNSPYHASSYGYICPQVYNPLEPVFGTEDEDCLHLNVFVPVGQESDEASGHAVMVRIHGGAFILGSSEEFDPKALCSAGNVIVVTFNYRLGSLGFLSTKDSNLVSNLGLWDQHLVLNWVRDNIGSFGGDTNRITVFGESAGAISAVIQGMYPGSVGLFQRIIAESGSPSVRSMNCSRNSRGQVMAIADRLECAADDTAKVIQCLRTIPWRKYMAEVNAMTENFENLDNVFFDPVVDGEFLKYDPRYISEMAKTQNITELDDLRSFDFLGGMNAYEGASYVPYFVGTEDPEQFEPTPDDMKKLLSIATGLMYKRTFPDPVMKMIEFEYTDWSNPSDFHNIRFQYMRIFGDTGMAVPTVEFGRLHSTSSKSKSYMFKFMPSPTNRRVSTPSWTPGADHGEETSFVFGVEELPNVTEWERQLSKLMMKYWTNFAKTGNPNSPVKVDPEWPEYELDTQYYMALDKVMNNDSVKQFLYAREYEFWNEVLPAVVSSFDKSSKETASEETPEEHVHVHDDL